MCIRDRNRLVNDQRVSFTHTTKYLGVTLDNKLKWTSHWNNITDSARQYIFMITPYITKRWGPNPKYIK